MNKYEMPLVVYALNICVQLIDSFAALIKFYKITKSTVIIYIRPFIRAAWLCCPQRSTVVGYVGVSGNAFPQISRR